MRKIAKKQLVIVMSVSIIILVGCICLYFKFKAKSTMQEYSLGNFENNQENGIMDNTILEVAQSDLIENKIDETIVEQAEIVQESILEESTKIADNSSQIVSQKTNTKTDEKIQQAVIKENTTQASSEVKVQEDTTQTQKPAEVPVQTQEPVKEETQTQPKNDKVENTSVKTISQLQFDNAVSTFLADINSTKPGLKCSYKKTSTAQVFWPYRKLEISVFTENLSFGTIYYYVEKFVESNEEKLKFYIDWAGN